MADPPLFCATVLLLSTSPFFTMVIAEDTETLRQWSPAHVLAESVG
jgi:hypothetical protein